MIVDEVADGLCRVRARVMNTGGFPTNITERGLTLRALKPVSAELLLPEGAELVSQTRYFELGHLGPNARSSELEWFVRCESGSEFTVRAEAQKAGVAERTLSC